MEQNGKLNILFLPAWYPSTNNPVAGVFVKEYAKAVSLFNEVVVIYREERSRKLKKMWEIVGDRKEDGIRTIRIKHKMSAIPKISYFIYLYSIRKILKKLLKEGWNPDIIHAYVYSAGVSAVLIGREYKIPVVITELATPVATHSLGFLNRKKLCFAMKKAKAILPISNDLRGAIENYYGIKNRFKVIPCVVNTKMFYPSSRRNNIGRIRILSVCILSSRKGIDCLLKSLYQLKKKRQDFTLDIVGNGPDRKELEGLARNLGLNEIVKFHGRKPEVVTFMRDCDFFVLPSLYENFGVVYIEAMACGKPVIGTTGGGPKEIITKETGILVPPKDIKVLTKAIDYMLDHYQDYSQEKISQYAKEKFSYEKVAKQIDNVYRELVSTDMK